MPTFTDATAVNLGKRPRDPAPAQMQTRGAQNKTAKTCPQPQPQPPPQPQPQPQLETAEEQLLRFLRSTSLHDDASQTPQYIYKFYLVDYIHRNNDHEDEFANATRTWLFTLYRQDHLNIPPEGIHDLKLASDFIKITEGLFEKGKIVKLNAYILCAVAFAHKKHFQLQDAADSAKTRDLYPQFKDSGGTLVIHCSL
jgi:hypothetical protein